jgi:hypothetical protein
MKGEKRDTAVTDPCPVQGFYNELDCATSVKSNNKHIIYTDGQTPSGMLSVDVPTLPCMANA